MKYEVQSETKHHLVIDFAGNNIRLPIDEDQKNVHQDNVVDLVIDLLVEYFAEVKIFNDPDEIIFYVYDFYRESLLAIAKTPWKDEYSEIDKHFHIDRSWEPADSKRTIRKIVKYFCCLD